MDFAAIVQGFFDSVPAAGQVLAGKMVDEGINLIWVCAGIALAYHLLAKIILADDPEGFKISVFDLLVKIGLCLTLIQSMNGLVRETFVDSAKDVATVIYSAAGKPENILKITFNTASFIITGEQVAAEQSEECKTQAPTGDWGDTNRYNRPKIPETCKPKVKDPQSGNQLGWTDYLSNINLTLLYFLVKAAAIIASIAMGIAFVLVVMISKLLLEIGIIVGPLFIGASVLPYLNFLFDNWIKYMLGAMVQQIVAWCMVAIVMGTIVPKAMESIGKINSAPKDAWKAIAEDTSVMVGLTIICAIGTFMFMSVPAIASELTGGGGTGSTKGFGRGRLSQTYTKMLQIPAKFLSGPARAKTRTKNQD